MGDFKPRTDIDSTIDHASHVKPNEPKFKSNTGTIIPLNPLAMVWNLHHHSESSSKNELETPTGAVPYNKSDLQTAIIDDDDVHQYPPSTPEIYHDFNSFAESESKTATNTGSEDVHHDLSIGHEPMDKETVLNSLADPIIDEVKQEDISDTPYLSAVEEPELEKPCDEIYFRNKKESETATGSTLEDESNAYNTGKPRENISTVIPNRKPLVHHDTVYLCTDGGSRSSSDLAATGWILYNQHWKVIHAVGRYLKEGTNNDTEMMAALEGLQYATNSCVNKRIVHLTDSKLVEGGITGNSKLNATRHKKVRNKIMSLQGNHGNFVTSYQVPREFNSGADRMCNLSMDLMSTTYQFNVSPSDIIEDSAKTEHYVTQSLDSSLIHYGESALMHHQYVFKWTLMELQFKGGCGKDTTFHAPGGEKQTKDVHGDEFVTGFETDTSPFISDGIERTIPPEALSKLKEECEKHGVPWHPGAFSKSEYVNACPKKDISLLSALCRAVGNDVSLIIRWYRNQTSNDNRPNKHLRPELYQEHLKSYPGLSDLCKIANDGFKSRVSKFTPPRPFTSNHQSATERSPAVQKKLIKEAMSGKTLILECDTASMDSRVNTCPYAVAPKNNVDYAFDGRLIHDGSFPPGSSVNDAVPVNKLDASTDDVKDIARRVLYLYNEFPNTKIFGMAADVDSAFQNAHAHEMSALLFGGSFPGAPYVAIALTAIFGYRDSPAIFALLAKAAQHFHRSGKSDIYNIPTSFWSWVWVDDFIGIEPDIGNRLERSEHSLRSSFHLVFGSPGWNNEKYAPWSNLLHAVGLDWNLSNGTVSMPESKISKAIAKVQECIDLIRNKSAPSVKTWRSLVGTLRHVGLCVPAAKPFYQSFVSTEKILLAHGSPQWNDLEWDLSWFRSILTKENLNGVTMERFVQQSNRTISLYLGWSSSSTFIIDFYMKKAIIIDDLDASLGGALLEYYVCTEILTPFAFGPFPRNDLQINLKCQTAGAAHRIKNWQFQNHSLRQLGWMCSQQHVNIIPSGPRINDYITLSSYTNTFLQILQSEKASVFAAPMVLPSVSELLNCNKPELDPAPVPRTPPSSKRGLNSAFSMEPTAKPFTSSIQSIKTRFLECSLQLVVWDMDQENLSVQKHFATYACPLSRATIKRNTTSSSQLDCVWTWVWKGIKEHTPPTHLRDSHLVPSLCASLELNSWPKVAPDPSLNGDVLSWGSSLSAEQEKCGVQLKRRTQITSSSGKISPTDMEQKCNENRMVLLSGLTSSSNPRKETDTRKELRFALEETKIRCYVPSKPYGGLKKEETLSTFGIMPIAAYLKSKEEWSSIGRPLSVGSSESRRKPDWTPPACLGTRCESVPPPNSWQQDLMQQLSSSWADGARTVTWPISG